MVWEWKQEGKPKIVGFLTGAVVDKITPVKEEDQELGLDLVHHGEIAYQTYLTNE